MLSLSNKYFRYVFLKNDSFITFATNTNSPTHTIGMYYKNVFQKIFKTITSTSNLIGLLNNNRPRKKINMILTNSQNHIKQLYLFNCN
jgi:hypothetical protein